MALKNVLKGLTMALPLLASKAWSTDSICRTRRSSTSKQRGACADRFLPGNRTRNLHVNSIHLECSSEVDHFIRTPSPFLMNDKKQADVVNEWLWLEEEKDRVKMQKWQHEHVAIPKWSGSIPYDIIEKWQWEDCVLGYDSGCPWKTRIVKVPVYDKKGRQVGTRNEKESYQPPCYHDETQYESRHCSSEQMNFDSEFIRPSTDPSVSATDSRGKQYPGYVWNPSSPGYYDVIPSKYDLMPGELEDVQLYSNASLSPEISPMVKIGDAWNQYHYDIEIDGYGRSASCEMRRYYNKKDLHLSVRVLTDKRIIGKTTPNAFRVGATDADGNALSTLGFDLGLSKKGKEVRTRPNKIRLVDTSAFAIEAMARQSRKATASRELQKAAAGEGISSTVEERKEVAEQSEKRGFYKDTRIRVKLWEVRGFFSRSIRLDKLYTDGSEVARSTFYLIPLDAKDSLYEIMGFSHHLKPQQKYRLAVAMYNHGVPFYRKENDGINALEGWYSQDLPIDFETSVEMKDSRGFFERYFIDHANATTATKWADFWSLVTFEWLRK